MSYRISRRRALAGLSAGLALPLAGCTLGGAGKTSSDTRFAHGVASGDPDHDSVVLWTRVSTGAKAVSGEWLLASDADCREVIKRGKFTTGADRDFTVKVLADGLASGQRYYYRFDCDGESSPVGRTMSLPEGHLDKLGFALASCSNYPFGYFNAYEIIALDPDVDVVLHLGDYLYEYGPDGYGGETGEQLGRAHQPPREIVSLSDYRQRHAQYKADLQSQAMHAAHPLIAIWDDHESANNPWQDGAENHQPDTEGDWQTRRRVSLQAYYEWMPVREPGVGMGRDQRWQHFRFGDLASLVILETRHSGRAEQIEYADYREQLKTSEDAQRFMREILGAPGRNMLSSEMESFLGESLRESVTAGRPWRLIGNQIPMARTHMPPIPQDLVEQLDIEPGHPLYEELTSVQARGALDLPLYTDPWDGYPWAREKFYATCSEAGAEDLLVLTGDSHSFWQNQLFTGEGKPMGLELGTTGITSPGDFINFGVEGARRMDQLVAQHNREVIWTEGVTHGYVRLVLTRDEASVDFVGVDNILGREYRPFAVRHAGIQRRDGHLSYS